MSQIQLLLSLALPELTCCHSKKIGWFTTTCNTSLSSPAFFGHVPHPHCLFFQLPQRKHQRTHPKNAKIPTANTQTSIISRNHRSYRAYHPHMAVYPPIDVDYRIPFANLSNLSSDLPTAIPFPLTSLSTL